MLSCVNDNELCEEKLWLFFWWDETVGKMYFNFFLWTNIFVFWCFGIFWELCKSAQKIGKKFEVGVVAAAETVFSWQACACTSRSVECFNVWENTMLVWGKFMSMPRQFCTVGVTRMGYSSLGICLLECEYEESRWTTECKWVWGIMEFQLVTELWMSDQW